MGILTTKIKNLSTNITKIDDRLESCSSKKKISKLISEKEQYLNVMKECQDEIDYFAKFCK